MGFSWKYAESVEACDRVESVDAAGMYFTAL